MSKQSFFFLAGALAALTACGGGGGGSSHAGSPDGLCTALALNDFTLELTAPFIVLSAPPTTNHGGPDSDFLFIDINETSLGTYALGMGVDDNYATCERCVFFLRDAADDGNGPDQTIFFADSGTFTLESAALQDDGLKGSIANIRLVEINIDGNSVSTPVANGSCYEISAAAWDFEQE